MTCLSVLIKQQSGIWKTCYITSWKTLGQKYPTILGAFGPFQTTTNHISFQVWLGSPLWNYSQWRILTVWLDFPDWGNWWNIRFLKLLCVPSFYHRFCIGFSFIDFVRKFTSFFKQGLERIILCDKKTHTVDPRPNWKAVSKELPRNWTMTMKVRDTDQEGSAHDDSKSCT